MKLTEIDILVLRALAGYYVLSASQIHRICFATNRDRRATRRRLGRLVNERFLARSSTQVAFSTGNAGPAYYLTERGREALAIYFDDHAFLKVNVKPPRLDHLYHWLDVSESHFVVEQAAATQPSVKLSRWINEWETTGDDSGAVQSFFVLHTQFRKEPPLSCSPDAAFMLEVGGYRRVHYVEVDRGTTGTRRVAASKTPGYHELARIRGHRRHFPDTTFDDFVVLIITTCAGRRDLLRHEVAKKIEFSPDLWLFIDRHEFTPDKAFFGDIAINHLGEVGSLVTPPKITAVGTQTGTEVTPCTTQPSP